MPTPNRRSFLTGCARKGVVLAATAAAGSVVVSALARQAAPPVELSGWWIIGLAIVSPDRAPTWGDVAHGFAIACDPDASAAYRAAYTAATRGIAREIGAQPCDPVRPTRAILDACAEDARRSDAARGEAYTPRAYLAAWRKAVAV